MGVKTKTSANRQEEDRVNHMIFADNCYLFAETKESDAEDDWRRYSKSEGKRPGLLRRSDGTDFSWCLEEKDRGS